jgi:hypothetical protein
MSRKHGKPKLEGFKKHTDYKNSNHTRNNFKEWLKKARYTELIDRANVYKEKIMQYQSTRAREGRIYPLQPSQNKIENLTMIKWKYNLLTNKINQEQIKGGLKNG